MQPKFGLSAMPASLDTDCYVQLTDMTVQKEAKSAREALTDEERAEVMTYREALRDMPALEGFPFVEYPTIPACIGTSAARRLSLVPCRLRCTGGGDGYTERPV